MDDVDNDDGEPKSIYKRILGGGDIPVRGLRKLALNNRGRQMDVSFVFFTLPQQGISCS